MKPQIIITLAKKEFFSFINSPLAYIVIIPFYLLSTFIFLRTILVNGEASLRPYIELLPWFLILLAPALSMKSLTDEQKSGTLELLFSHPMSEFEIVIAKFLGIVAFFIVILFTTISLPISLFLFSKPDLGLIIAQYLGALFVGATFIAIGLAASSYVKNAIASFLLAASIGFGLILVGLEFVSLLLPWPFSRIAQELSILSHMESVSRGLLDVRDIVYFLTVTSLFLLLTTFKLSERKFVEKPAEKRKLSIAFGLILTIGVVANILTSYYPIRLDVTQERLFTLSSGTKQTLQNLPDIVTITLYTSKNLPGPLQVTRKEIEDLLKDYTHFGKRLVLKVTYPDLSPQAASEAQSNGIREVTFNTIGTSKFEAQTGYLGLSIRFGDKTESLPFIQATQDLEYQLTRRVRKLTADKEKIVGLSSDTSRPLRLFQDLLSTQYKITPIDLTNQSKTLDVATLIVVDEGLKESSISGAIKNYLDNNGKVFLLTNGVSVNKQFLTTSVSKTDLPFLSEYGITRNKDLVYDRELNETLTFGDNNGRYLLPYPFWLRALPAPEFKALSGLKSVLLAWPSSLSVNKISGLTYTDILTTSKTAGRQENPFTISPRDVRSLPTPLGKNILLAESVQKGQTRLAVVGNAEITNDEYLQNNQENAVFLSNIVDWLTDDRELSSIKIRSEGKTLLQFQNPIQLLIFQYGNLLLPPIVVVAFALYWLTRRKKLTFRNL